MTLNSSQTYDCDGMDDMAVIMTMDDNEAKSDEDREEQALHKLKVKTFILNLLN